MGHLEHAAQVCPWGRHLYTSLRRAVNQAIKICTSLVKKKSDIKAMVAILRDLPSTAEKDMYETFSQKKIAQEVYRCNKKFFITKDMNQELKILHHILNNPSWYKWQAPIASLIPHDPTFIAWGDSSLYA